MQSSLIKTCSICQQNLTIQQISFSCEHSFCFNCFPYIMIYIVETIGIKRNIFENPDQSYPCLICQKGFAKLPFDKLHSFQLDEPSPKAYKSSKISKISKITINNPIKEVSKSSISSLSKSNSSRSNSNSDIQDLNSFIDDKPPIIMNPLMNCKCSKGNKSEVLCINCQISCCLDCALSKHKNHDQKEICEILSKNNEIYYKKCKSQMDSLLDGFIQFRKILEESIKKAMDSHINEFNQLFHQIFSLFNKIKEKFHKQKENDTQNIITYLSIIETSFIQLNEDIELMKINNLHPNKLFQLTRFFNENDEKIFLLKNFSIQTQGNSKLKEIKEELEKLQNQKNSFEFLVDIEKSRIHEEFVKKAQIPLEISSNNDIFLTNPVNLFNEKPILLEKGLFHPRFWKSRVSASFMLEDMTFLAFAGEKNKKTTNFPLYVYNISTYKQEDILYESNAKISLVATYPEYAKISSKKWLYTADDAGILRIFELTNGKAYNKLIKLETKYKKTIISAIIFDDIYKELSENCNFQYLAICFADGKLPILIYKLEVKGSNVDSILIKEIANPFQEICFSMNFFHNENIEKTLIFMGFSHSFIKIFDLRTNLWFKQEFETQSDVSSINFIRKNEKTPEYLILYTQWNCLIFIYNIETAELIKQITLNNVKYILDLCIWDQNNGKYMIISSHNQNSIKVISLENYEILCSIQTGSHLPINIIKTLVNVMNDGKKTVLKECIISLQYLKDEENSIVCFV